MKHVSEILPSVMNRIMNPEPKRPDVPVSDLLKVFNFELWEAPDGWTLPNGKPGPLVKPQLERMLQEVFHFGRDQHEKKHPRWLSLLGSSGVGKTYLSKKLFKLYQGSSSRQFSMSPDGVSRSETWVDWPELAGDLQQNEGQGLMDQLQGDYFVVLDEIGADRDKNGHVRDCLARLCSTRVNKWTIITSNLSMSQIEQSMDTRIASRMTRDGSRVVEILAPDFNLRNSD